MLAISAHATEIEVSNPDIKLRWDNTIKYSNSWRIKRASDELIGAINQDDGDRNFSRGLISNRFDVLSEFDVSYKGFGARVSGAAWYDTVYNRSTDNTSPATANAFSVPFNDFTAATEKLHGRKAELLDAFLFGKVDLGESNATFRIGRHTLLWGESLFFGANGIAGGQASVDIVKALSVPNTQFKELIRPTPQISAQLQLSSTLSIGAYYQWRWQKNRFPAVGSYFSNVDVLDDGGERLLVGPPVVSGGGPLAFFRGQDIEAKNSGQGGAQVRFRLGETDLGLYAIRYHDKSPQLYMRPTATDPVTGRVGEYLWVYPENIRSFGASASHTFGDVNVAGEVSARRNTPLASGGQVDLFGVLPPSLGGPNAAGDNRGNPLYAVGNSVHAQISWLASLGPSFISREADFLGELAWNRRTSITKNSAALNPNADKEAFNLRFIYEPKFRQAWSGLDLSVPVGFGYGIGNSSVVGSFNGNHVGDVSVGLNGLYLNAWRIGLTYTHFFGPQGAFLDSRNLGSFKQSLKDRDFISLSIQRTF